MAALRRALISAVYLYVIHTTKAKKAYTHINGAGLICTELRQSYKINAIEF
tara:strand:+ start:215 stop:367 length:153 start_codon:yes stop_codon:yes gene_type:complete